MNLSAILEKALEAELRKSKEAKWLEENKTVIVNCNELAKNMVFLLIGSENSSEAI